MAMPIYSYTGLPGLCGCRLCAPDMSRSEAVADFMHPSAFFPSMTFFLAISALSCAPFQFFTVQDLVRGECDVWSFCKHNLAFVPFFFLSPPSCGGAVGGVPSVGDLHPTDNSNYNVCASVDTQVVNIILS